MISKETLQIEWINQVSENNRKADKILLEKMIRALFLVEGLAESGLSFIFKGGTAVMLLQGIPNRFSIDVDIVVPERKDFDNFFNKFLPEKGFSRFELHERNTSPEIEKLHYKFFYTPVQQSNIKEDNILLDVLIETTKYKKIPPVVIDSPFVKQEEAPLKVNIPSIDDIVGDKLTAFAPNTTGIPYEKSGFSKAMEIIKQLYDIGTLFKEVKDLSIIAETFNNIAKTEMKYRNFSGTTNDVLDDIVQTALCLSTRGKAGKGDFEALQNGVSQIRAFIFSESYHIEKVIVHASRTAYLAKLIEQNKKEMNRFNEPMQVKDWLIGEPMDTKLNKFKKSNPEAFFYWYQIYQLNSQFT